MCCDNILTLGIIPPNALHPIYLLRDGTNNSRVVPLPHNVRPSNSSVQTTWFFPLFVLRTPTVNDVPRL